MIDWFPATARAPSNRVLLLAYEGGSDPVFGHAYHSCGKQLFASSQARGVTWTHWAYINMPAKGKRK